MPSLHLDLDVVAAMLFGAALLHTFAAKAFERLAHHSPRHAGLWHLLGEIEVVFGFWAFVLIGTMAWMVGGEQAIEYAETRKYTEPLFVFAIMAVGAMRRSLVIRLLEKVELFLYRRAIVIVSVTESFREDA